MTGFESTATYPVWHDSATQQTAFETAPAHAEVDMAIVGEVNEIEANEVFVVKFFYGMQNSVVFDA